MVINVQGDPELARIFTEFKVTPEPSLIITTDWVATAFNREKLGTRKRIVDLSCRHKAVTRNRYKMICPRCAKMMQHGFDYDGWLKGFVCDELIWPGDPCRGLNERLD